jgi:hypothetical protein
MAKVATKAGRPRAENPRAAALNIRMTDEERSAIEAHLEAVNAWRISSGKHPLKMSDWARARLLSEIT